MSSPSNEGTLVLKIETVDGQTIRDSNARLQIVALQDAGRKKELFHKKVSLPLGPIPMPAFPQVKEIFCHITTTRFREATTKMFKVSGTGETEVTLKLLREPGEWKPSFTSYNELPASFDKLKRVLEASPQLKVRKGEGLAFFIESNYDQVTQSSNEQTRAAKLGLLNLYTKMTNLLEPAKKETNWFSYVEEILEIAQSRMIALVNLDMGTKVQDIIGDFSKFDGYEPSFAGNHFVNMPPQFKVDKNRMFTVKTEDKKGNLQLTFGPGKRDGKDVLVLDADIDESGTLLTHLMDVLRHKITKQQTHPFDVHEFIAKELHEAKKPNDFIPLGYDLV